MTSQEIAIILQILKVACPQLKRMAERTPNPLDDIIVGLVCSVAALNVLPDILKDGGE